MTLKGMRKVRDLISIILAMARTRGMEDITARITDHWNSQTMEYDVVIEIHIPGC